MINFKRHFTLLLLMILTFSGYSQTPEIDSLLNNLKIVKEDTNKVNTLNLLSKHAGWRIGNIDTATYYADEAKKLSEKIGYKKGMANAINNFGAIHYSQGNFPEALKYYYESLEIKQKIGDKEGIAFSYNNIGSVYYSQGNYPEALQNYLASVKIKEEIGDLKGKAATYANIGIVYSNQGNYTESLKYHLISLKLNEELGNKRGVANCYNNIGGDYFTQGNTKESLKNHLASLKIKQEIGDQYGIAASYGNIGAIHLSDKNYDEALQSYLASLKILEEIGDQVGIAYSYYSIGVFYNTIKKTKESKIWQQKALSKSIDLGAKEISKNSFLQLTQIDSTLGNFKDAFENYKMYIIYRDSLINEENTIKLTQTKMQFDFDKKQAADSINNVKQKEIQQAKIDKQQIEIKSKQNQQYGLIGGIILVLVFGLFMYNRFKVTQKQKHIIEVQKSLVESQKHMVEEKNKEITDSINYAKRIQEAILPSRYSLVENLKNGFILFKPKYVVSGDFYWLETTTPLAPSNGGGTGEVYFAAADCTGHGVPGAMVSVICSNALSKALLEEGITETGKLLDRTRELVIERFAKSGEQVKDGMDISLCKLSGNRLEWSGANNPLWIVKKNEMGKNELLEIKPDKQPIGNYADPKPFSTHTIQLSYGDSIYIFTDGFADQFGGPKGKKFMYKPFKELLLSLQDNSMDEQKILLEKQFEDWKGGNEQIDDVCIIGVRI